MKLAVALEGTLSDAMQRQELRNESFEEYQAAVSEDIPNKKLIEFLNEHNNDELVIYSTTPENYRPAIMEWLLENGVDADQLLLKKKSDYRPEYEIKVSMIMGLNSLDKECKTVIENSQKVADLLREQDFLVLQT